MAFTPYNPFAETHIHRQNLPHWRQWGTTYFVTTRLADSVPGPIAADWRRTRDAWLQAHGIRSTDELPKLTDGERHEYHREFTARFHELLDAGHGECVLANAACADILIARLLAGHGAAYQIDAWCIMPNHLHALVEPAEHVTLGEITTKSRITCPCTSVRRRSRPLWRTVSFS
jgi:putative transposase